MTPVHHTTDPSPESNDGLVRLIDCPPGLFVFNGSYGFRSEYGPDAYCLESGEYFWGGVSGDKAKRAELLVEPLALEGLIGASFSGFDNGLIEALRAAQNALWQYLSDLKYPPAGDSIERRIAAAAAASNAVDAALTKVVQS